MHRLRFVLNDLYRLGNNLSEIILQLPKSVQAASLRTVFGEETAEQLLQKLAQLYLDPIASRSHMMDLFKEDRSPNHLASLLAADDRKLVSMAVFQQLVRSVISFVNERATGPQSDEAVAICEDISDASCAFLEVVSTNPQLLLAQDQFPQIFTKVTDSRLRLLCVMILRCLNQRSQLKATHFKQLIQKPIELLIQQGDLFSVFFRPSREIRLEPVLSLQETTGPSVRQQFPLQKCVQLERELFSSPRPDVHNHQARKSVFLVDRLFLAQWEQHETLFGAEAVSVLCSLALGCHGVQGHARVAKMLLDRVAKCHTDATAISALEYLALLSCALDSTYQVETQSSRLPTIGRRLCLVFEEALERELQPGETVPVKLDVESQVMRAMRYPEQAVCTFVSSHASFLNQQWFCCHTCGIVGSEGVCGVCAFTCHKGHNLTPEFSTFFCDCGAGHRCKALTRRLSKRRACCSQVKEQSVLLPWLFLDLEQDEPVEPTLPAKKVINLNRSGALRRKYGVDERRIPMPPTLPPLKKAPEEKSESREPEVEEEDEEKRLAPMRWDVAKSELQQNLQSRRSKLLQFATRVHHKSALIGREGERRVGPNEGVVIGRIRAQLAQGNSMQGELISLLVDSRFVSSVLPALLAAPTPAINAVSDTSDKPMQVSMVWNLSHPVPNIQLDDSKDEATRLSTVAQLWKQVSNLVSVLACHKGGSQALVEPPPTNVFDLEEKPEAQKEIRAPAAPPGGLLNLMSELTLPRAMNVFTELRGSGRNTSSLGSFLAGLLSPDNLPPLTIDPGALITILTVPTASRLHYYLVVASTATMIAANDLDTAASDAEPFEKRGKMAIYSLDQLFHRAQRAEQTVHTELAKAQLLLQLPQVSQSMSNQEDAPTRLIGETPYPRAAPEGNPLNMQPSLKASISSEENSGFPFHAIRLFEEEDSSGSSDDAKPTRKEPNRTPLEAIKDILSHGKQDLLKQFSVPLTKMTKVCRASTGFVIQGLAPNPCNEAIMAVFGPRDCLILGVTCNGQIGGRIYLTPELEDKTEQLIKCVWLPGSTRLVALLTTQSVQIFDILRLQEEETHKGLLQVSQPNCLLRYHFKPVEGKFQDVSFVKPDVDIEIDHPDVSCSRIRQLGRWFLIFRFFIFT
ncbi:Ubiquitin protein ligase E3 component n-recognin 4 [Cichlidogyrus casuarinus]|uniref:Ubiquitin protein ligase E3 component n-recognin 4 n=1 Tax=Cichlidogyrus casuarinus TaxID=1844966 RepID=A0ABD2QKZ1_9PLAT